MTTGRSRQEGFQLVCRFFCLDDGTKKLLYTEPSKGTYLNSLNFYLPSPPLRSPLRVFSCHYCIVDVPRLPDLIINPGLRFVLILDLRELIWYPASSIPG